MTLRMVWKETGIPLRTLQHAASTGKLIALLKPSPVGDYYETTMTEVERWRKLYYRPKVSDL